MEDLTQRDRTYLATGFRDVDEAAGSKMVHCLSYLDSLPSFREYKELIVRTLNPQPGDTVADLGCGLGYDVLRLAETVGSHGHAAGVDASLTMLAFARARSRSIRNVEFIGADVHGLPFSEKCLDSCKVDRTLQHVEQPAEVLGEVFRVLRPGGIAVCSEPDWGTFTIDDDDGPMVKQISELWAGSFRNPWIGRQLLNRLRDAGFVDVRVQGTLLVAPSFEASDKVFDVVQTAARLAKATESKKPQQWIARAQERDVSRPVWSCVTLFIYFARKPL